MLVLIEEIGWILVLRLDDLLHQLWLLLLRGSEVVVHDALVVLRTENVSLASFKVVCGFAD